MKKIKILLFINIFFFSFINAQIITKDVDTTRKTYYVGQNKFLDTLKFKISGSNKKYYWFRNNVAANNNGNLIDSAEFFVPKTDFTGDNYYYSFAIDTFTNDTTKSRFSGLIKIIDCPNSIFFNSNINSDTVIYCKNSTPSPLFFTSDYPYLSYKWFSKTTLDPSPKLIPSSNNDTFYVITSQVSAYTFYFAKAYDLVCKLDTLSLESNPSAEIAVVDSIFNKPNFNDFRKNIYLCYDSINSSNIFLKAQTIGGDTLGVVPEYQWYLKNFNAVDTSFKKIDFKGKDSIVQINQKVGDPYKYNNYSYKVSINNACNTINQTFDTIVIQPLPKIDTLASKLIPDFLNVNSRSLYCLNYPTKDTFAYLRNIPVTGQSDSFIYKWVIKKFGSNDTIGTSDTNFIPIKTSQRGVYEYIFTLKQKNYACSATSKIKTVVGINSVVDTLNSKDFNFCQNSLGDTISLKSLEVNTTNNKYQWYYKEYGKNADSILKGDTNYYYIIPTKDTFTNRRYLVNIKQNASSGCGNYPDSITQYSKLASIYLQPTVSYDSNLRDTNYCQNFNLPKDIIAFSNTVNVKYKWFYVVKNNLNNTDSIELTLETFSSVKPTTRVPGEYYYKAIVSKQYNPLTTCYSNSNYSSKIIIKDNDIFNFIPNNISICSLDSLNNSNAPITEFTENYDKTVKIISKTWFKYFPRNDSTVRLSDTSIQFNQSQIVNYDLNDSLRFILQLNLSNQCTNIDNFNVQVLPKPKYLSYSDNYFTRDSFCQKLSEYLSTTQTLSFGTDKSILDTIKWYFTKDSIYNFVNKINFQDTTPSSFNVIDLTPGNIYFFSTLISKNKCRTNSAISAQKYIKPQPEGQIDLDSNHFTCINSSPKSSFYIKNNSDTLNNTVSWYKLITSSEFNQGNIDNGNWLKLSDSNRYLPPPNNTAVTNYYSIRIVNKNSTCRFYSNIDSVIWVDSVKFEIKNTQDTFYCKNAESLPFILKNLSTNNIAVKWYISSNKFDLNDTLISNSTDPSFKPITDLNLLKSDTNYYYAIIRDTNLACPSVTSSKTTKIVIKYPKIIEQPSLVPNKACFNFSDSFKLLSVKIKDPSDWNPKFIWLKSTNNINKDDADTVSIQNNSDFSPSASDENGDTSFYYAVVEQDGTVCKGLTDTSNFSGPVITYPFPETILIHDTLCLGSTLESIPIKIAYEFKDPLKYQWFQKIGLKDSLLLNDTSINYFPNLKETGNYSFYVIVRNSQNCTFTSNNSNIYIGKLPSFQYQTNSVSYCINSTTESINLTSINAFQPISIQWYKNDTLIPNYANNFIYPTSNNFGVFKYAAVITDNYGCTSINSNPSNIKIIQPPKVKINTSNDNNFNILVGQTLPVYGTGGYLYLWSPENLFSINQNDTSNSNPLIINQIQKPTAYSYKKSSLNLNTLESRYIVVKGFDSASTCFSFDSVYINVYPNNNQLIFPTQIITNNNDKINDYLYIKNLEKYPTNKIYIYNESLNYEVRILENYQNNFQWKGTDTYGSKLPTGTYYYLINLYQEGNIFYKLKGYITIVN